MRYTTEVRVDLLVEYSRGQLRLMYPDLKTKADESMKLCVAVLTLLAGCTLHEQLAVIIPLLESRLEQVADEVDFGHTRTAS